MWSLALIISVLFVSYGHGEVNDIAVGELPFNSPSETHARIIGGLSTIIERFPFMVQVWLRFKFICAGVLISTRHVLSAAHCFVEKNGDSIAAVPDSSIIIHVGASQLNSGGTMNLVSRIIIHEQYHHPQADNDIAVLLLYLDVTPNHQVRFASLPAQDFVVPDGAPVIAVGWGQTILNVSHPASVLNEVKLVTVNIEICSARYNVVAQYYRIPNPVTNKTICTGILDIGGKGICKGDSGGPVIYGYNDIVVGIISGSSGCAHPTYPSLSIRVASYTNWINNIMGIYNSGPSLPNLSCAMILTTLFIAILNTIVV